MISALELLLVILAVLTPYLYQRFAGREKSDIQLENQTLQQLEKDGKLLRESHPRVQAILNHLYSRVNTDKSGYRQFAISDPAINAMALPASTILLTSGFTKAIDEQMFSDDEIAGILAHEIGHIEKGHASKKVEEEARTYMMKTGIGLVSRHPIIKVISDAFSNLATKNLSRQCEYEADAYSQELLGVSRYQQDGLIKALMKMKSSQQPSQWKEFFSTHPDTDERIKRLRELLYKSA